MECVLCQSSTNKVFARVTSFDIPLVYYQCANCGLVFQSSEESKAADPAFYAETYRDIYQFSAEPTQKDLWVQEQRARHLVAFLTSQRMSAPNRALDIGASAGVLLADYRSAFDCDVTGVEPGDAYRAYAEAKGMRMLPSIEALQSANPQKFDLVSLIHVLEHLVHPVETLGTIRKELLADDGCLLLEVPNFYAHDSYELAHLVCYTPHTLGQVVQQAGYRVLQVKAHGVPRSSLLNLYLTVLAVPLPQGQTPPALKPDRHVHQKRQLGFIYRRIAQKIAPHQAWLPLPDQEEN